MEWLEVHIDTNHAGLEPLEDGRIFLDDEDITKKPPKDRNVGMIFQQYSLFPTMTVYNNIAFGLKMKKTSSDIIKAMVGDALRMVSTPADATASAKISFTGPAADPSKMLYNWELRDARGQVREVWILSPQEAALPLKPVPTTRRPAPSADATASYTH